MVEILLDYNASINLRDLVERTPLHWAAIGGHGDVCDFLIQKGTKNDGAKLLSYFKVLSNNYYSFHQTQYVALTVLHATYFSNKSEK